MNSVNKKNCKAQNEDVNKAKAALDEATTALAEVTKQEADKEKQQADAEAGFIIFVVSSAALGLVSRCHIPVAAVAQRGLFRILLGDPGVIITDSKNKSDPGYIYYGVGEFDEQVSGHDYNESLYMTPTAAVGNLSNGGIAGTFADYVLQT